MSNGNLPQRPELRAVDVFPVDGEQGRKAFGIRDPQHITDKILHLPAEAAYALQFFDGQHTLPAMSVCSRFDDYGPDYARSGASSVFLSKAPSTT